jgi:putative molybdopterin biosynthesis protein
MAKLPTPLITFSSAAELTLGKHTLNLAELKRILRIVADTQSIADAALTLGVTYRTLWGRLLSYDDATSCKLVGKARGRGTTLTGKGRALLAALEKHDELFAPPALDRINALATDLRLALQDQLMLRLRASHDYAIARAMSQIGAGASTSPTMSATSATTPPLSSMIFLENAGSVDCVRALLRGDADLAGYHHISGHSPVTTSDATDTLWQRIEDSEYYWSVALIQREQGLIVSPSKRTAIKSIADLARRDVRFINRQRGSGTRLLLDALLAQGKVMPSSINGYDQEEFTHQAIAATVAADAADVGPGLRAAAAQFKLHFVPLATETYRLAGRIETRKHAAVVALIEAVRAQASQLPGYAPS